MDGPKSWRQHPSSCPLRLSWNQRIHDLIAKPKRASFTVRVPFDFLLSPKREPVEFFLRVGERLLPIVFVRHPRARRYVLRLRPDGFARVTIPRGGSTAEGRRFAERNKAWLQSQLSAAKPTHPKPWALGTEIFFRGELVKLESPVAGTIRFGIETITVSDHLADLRPAIESHLRVLAAKELPPRLLELAASHQLAVHRVTVRDQRSRWGSCSRKRTISLNWRLIQTPPYVRDYILLHELMHLREMSHSARFWREVERVCPDYLTAERWLKQNLTLRK
jgi:predicted metal-dependent hydrolase